MGIGAYGQTGHKRADRRAAGHRTRPLTTLAEWLDDHSGPRTVLGICAVADGRLAATLLPRADVGRLQACLVEENAVGAAVTSQAFRLAGLGHVTVVHADPGSAQTYVGRVPADLILLGPGVIDGSPARRRGLGEALPELLTPGGEVYWWSAQTGDLTPWLRVLAATGIHPSGTLGEAGGGLARLVGRPRPLRGERLYPV